MKVSQEALEKLKQFEGIKQVGYLDAVGKLTIGVGHLVKSGEPYKLGQKISMAEVDKLLRYDLAKFENAVSSLVKVPITQNQFDSLVSLAFNIGESGFQKSSVLKFLNQGKVAEAADAFLKWNKAGGKVLSGLTKRRESEKSWFLSNTALTVIGGGLSIGVIALIGLGLFFLIED